MTKYRACPDATLEADTSTGAQTLGTPWGIVTIRKGDVIVPFGNQAVPVPGELWRQWFANVDPVPPSKPSEPFPDKPLAEWLRRDLDRYMSEVHGVPANQKLSMSQLVHKVRELRGEHNA